MEGVGGVGEDVQAAAVRIMRRAQWFFMSLPITRRRWAVVGALLSEIGPRFEHCLWRKGGVGAGNTVVFDWGAQQLMTS